MKKLITFLLSCLCLLLMIGCGTDDSFHEVQTTNSSVSSETQEQNSGDLAGENFESQDSPFDYTSVSMNPVNSTMIAEEGYDNEHEILLLRFRSNAALYEYFDVSSDVYNEFLSADSKGSYFSSSIRDIYRYERLESGEGYYIEPLYSETTKEVANYALNTNTGKFHTLECRYSEAENIVYVSNSKQELLDLKYEACKVCNP